MYIELQDAYMTRTLKAKVPAHEGAGNRHIGVVNPAHHVDEKFCRPCKEVWWTITLAKEERLNNNRTTKSCVEQRRSESQADGHL
jgi:hypothetical protein